MKISELLVEAKAVKTRLDKKCWKGKKIGKPKTKVKGGVRVNNCVPKESTNEGESKDSIMVIKTIKVPGASKDSGTYSLINHKGILYITKNDVFMNPAPDITDAEDKQRHQDEVKAMWKNLLNLSKVETDKFNQRSTPAASQTWNRSMHEAVELGDGFFLELGDLLIETTVVGKSADKIIIEGDDIIIKLLEKQQELVESVQLTAEAKYQGREVPLGKPMKGDVKKSKVYVRKPNGKIVKVNFGDKKMRIKKSNPKRRKSFRARHNCKNPGPRWKARYWSCRAW